MYILVKKIENAVQNNVQKNRSYKNTKYFVIVDYKQTHIHILYLTQ